MKLVSNTTRFSLNPRFMILRGVVSVLFGILALAWPGPGLLAIAFLYGAYAFSDGILAITTGIRRGKQHESWGLPIVEGILGVGAGIITVLWPGITLLVLSILVGVWALSTGVLEVLAALNLRNYFPEASGAGRVLLGVAGLLSIALGVIIFMMPAMGAITLLTLVASYSIIFGMILMGLGFRLHRERKIAERPPLTKVA